MIALETIRFIAFHLLALLLLGSTCLLLGRLCLHRVSFHSGAEEVGVSTLIGFGLVGEVLFLLGLARWLHAPLIVLLVVLVHLAAAAALRDRWSGLREMWTSTTVTARRLGSVALAMSLLPVFSLALYPPAAFDATLYHLPYAARFAREHAVVFADTLRFPVFPQLNEMLFTGMLLTYDDVAAHLVELLALLTTALLLYSWGARYRRRAGLLAAVLFLGNPIAIYLGSTGYIDAGLALFFVGALLSWTRWEETGSRQWLTLSAVAAGFAAATKYHGLLLVVALSVVTIWRGARDRRWMSVAIFVVAAGVVASPFYVRNYLQTENPIFPYLSRTFGVSEWRTGVDREIESRGSLIKAMTSENFAVLREEPFAPVSYLWRLSIDRETLRGLPPYSPFYALLSPLIVWLAVTRPRLRVAAAIGVVYLLLVAGRDVRFLLPAAGLFALYGGLALDRMIPRRRLLTWALALTLLAPGLAWAARHLWKRGPLPVTEQLRDGYLAGRMVGYAQLELLNRKHGSDYTVYALDMENAAYFAEGRFLGDHFGPYRFQRIRSLTSAQALHEELRQMGVDYLLVRAAARIEGLIEPGASPLFELVESDDTASLYRLTDR